jgi:hypothetical protein
MYEEEFRFVEYEKTTPLCGRLWEIDAPRMTSGPDDDLTRLVVVLVVVLI